MPIRGFILQPTYRIEDRLPVIHLYGRLENGEAFLVRETRQAPHFFVRAADAAGARRRGAGRQRTTDLRTFRGEPVVRVEVDTPREAPPCAMLCGPTVSRSLKGTFGLPCAT